MDYWIVLILSITNLMAIFAAFDFAGKSHRYRDESNYHRDEKDRLYGEVHGLRTKNEYLESLIKKPEQEAKE